MIEFTRQDCDPLTPVSLRSLGPLPRRGRGELARRARWSVLLLVVCVAGFAGEEKKPAEVKGPGTFTHRIAGLCYPERVEDLKETIALNASVELVSINYERQEATVKYNTKQFGHDSFTHLMHRGAFNVKPPLTIPEENLQKLEIPVKGLDCKGCCLGTYNALNRVDGVERATVNLKDGLVVAMIDPAKTNRAAVIEALKKAQVGVPEAEKPVEKK